MKIKVKIPEKSKVVIKQGQKVNFSTPLAQILQKQMVYIPIADILSFDPKNIFHYLKQVIGDEIQKGDILAEHKNLFTTRQYLSEVSGILREIKHDTGIISIEQNKNDSSIINCFFNGEIDGIYDGFLELQIEDAHTTKLRKETPYFGASIYYLNATGKYSDEDLENACVFTSDINSLEIVKMETLGAQGIITKSKFLSDTNMHQVLLDDEKDFDQIQKKEYPYMLIGHEPMTVIFYK